MSKRRSTEKVKILFRSNTNEKWCVLILPLLLGLRQRPPPPAHNQRLPHQGHRPRHHQRRWRQGRHQYREPQWRRLRRRRGCLRQGQHRGHERRPTWVGHEEENTAPCAEKAVVSYSCSNVQGYSWHILCTRGSNIIGTRNVALFAESFPDHDLRSSYPWFYSIDVILYSTFENWFSGQRSMLI